MHDTKTRDLFAAGLAIFAMFFGAGNIIFPLALGQQTAEQAPYAVLGLLITAVLVPFSGLLAMFLYQGKIQPFFGRLGLKAGFCLAFFIIALLGPLGSTPRCIALSFSTLNLAYPGINPLWFNTIACGCIFLMAYKKQHLLKILGYVLTPVLLILLIWIIIKGFWSPSLEVVSDHQSEAWDPFWRGLKEGYNTMDLLAAFFFAPVIIQLTQLKIGYMTEARSRLGFVFKASLIGGVLLGLIYISFCLLASRHAQELQGVPAAELLGVMALNMLGPWGGIFVCLTVVLACMTTAVALITAFTGFVHQDVLKRRFSYPWVLGLSLVLTDMVACFEFQGITEFLTPVLEVSYPFLILLTAYHLIERLYTLKGLPQSTQELSEV